MTELFTEVEVCGFAVRPWTLAQMARLSPALMSAIKTAEDAGVDWETALDGMDVPTLTRIVLAAMPHMPDILAVSLNVERDKVDALDVGKVIRIAQAIWTANEETVKNSFSLGQTP